MKKYKSIIHQTEILKEEFEFCIGSKNYFIQTKVLNIGMCDQFEQIIFN